MPRLPFNTTCDVRTGPDAPLPNTYVGTFNCRLVIEDAIHTVGPGLPPIPAYLTIQDYSPTDQWDAAVYYADPGLADQIAVPSGSAYAWWAFATYEVIWRLQHLYYRSQLMELPLPSPSPTITYLHFGPTASTFADSVTAIGYPGIGTPCSFSCWLWARLAPAGNNIQSSITPFAGWQTLGQIRVTDTIGVMVSFGSARQGRWVNLVVTTDNVSTSIYLNGVLDITSILVTCPNTWDGTIGVGGAAFDYWIQDYRVYKTSLTALQVSNIYIEGPNGTPSLAPFNQYKCNERVGDILYQTATGVIGPNPMAGVTPLSWDPLP